MCWWRSADIDSRSHLHNLYPPENSGGKTALTNMTYRPENPTAIAAHLVNF